MALRARTPTPARRSIHHAPSPSSRRGLRAARRTTRAPPGRAHAGITRSTCHRRERDPAPRAAPAPAGSPARRRMATRSCSVTCPRTSSTALSSSSRTMCRRISSRFRCSQTAIVPDHHQESHAGENSERTHRLVESEPGQGRAGNRRPGGMPHLIGVLLPERDRHTLWFVPYRGTAVAINDLVAGHIDLLIDAANNTLPHVRAGAIKAYAVTAKSRLPAAPDIPTVDEAGLPGFHFQLAGVFCAQGYAATRLSKAACRGRRYLGRPGGSPSSRRSRSVEIFPREQQTPEALAALHQADIEKWWPIIKAANIKPE